MIGVPLGLSPEIAEKVDPPITTEGTEVAKGHLSDISASVNTNAVTTNPPGVQFMTGTQLFIFDLIAIAVMTLGIYFPRHRRKDMVVAYLGINVGILAVANALTTSAIGAGLGLGLFGVLSIIRLRSLELDQQEIAYYFAALALGLLAGLSTSESWIPVILMAIVVGVMYLADHPAMFGSYRIQVINLDRAFTDEASLKRHLTSLLDAKIHRVTVRKVDLVNDTTSVEVRFQQRSERSDGDRRQDAGVKRMP